LEVVKHPITALFVVLTLLSGGHRILCLLDQLVTVDLDVK